MLRFKVFLAIAMVLLPVICLAQQEENAKRIIYQHWVPFIQQESEPTNPTGYIGIMWLDPNRYWYLKDHEDTDKVRIMMPNGVWRRTQDDELTPLDEVIGNEFGLWEIDPGDFNNIQPTNLNVIDALWERIGNTVKPRS